MKKLIPVISFLLLASLPRAVLAQPSSAMIEDATAWAESLVGRDSFPFVGGGGFSWSLYGCADFVANAFGRPSSDADAYLLWCCSDQHPGDWNAPRGSLVFFSRTAVNSGLGHAALCTGNGNIVEAGYDAITTNTIADENKIARYLGWAWPLSNWPGRAAALKQ